MNSEMISSIIDYPSEALLTVPKADGFIQQLCGIYSKDIIPYIENIISNDLTEENRDSSQIKRKCKIHNLITSVPSTIIEDIKVLDGFQDNIFFNMNKPEDYKLIFEFISNKK
jgi:molybdopterin-guanine dinucleotide biosynthesis protein A